MSELNFDLLKRLCETPGISSREELDQIRPLRRKEAHSDCWTESECSCGWRCALAEYLRPVQRRPVDLP